MTNSEIEVGSSFSFENIGGFAGQLWVCFGRSQLNNKIHRLAPVTAEQVSPRAVKVRSTSLEDAWIAPEIEIGIHDDYLRRFQPGPRFEVIRTEVSNETAGERTEKIHELENEARRIEAKIDMRMEDQEFPRLEECQRVEVGHSPTEFSFAWEPDLGRHYLLKLRQDGWKLNQTYQLPGSEKLPDDQEFCIGDDNIEFNREGESVNPLSTRQLKQFQQRYNIHLDGASRTEPTLHRLLDWLRHAISSHKVVAPLAATAMVLIAVALVIPVGQPGGYEVENVYVSSAVRGADETERAIIVEIRTTNVNSTVSRIEKSLTKMGLVLSVSSTTPERVIIIGSGGSDYRALLDSFSAEQPLDLEGVQKIEILITGYER